MNSTLLVLRSPLKSKSLLLFPILTLLVIAKDLLHATYRNYSFYLHESLLFGTFWLLFPPLILLSRSTLFKKLKFSGSILLSILHMGLFACLVFSISALFFNYTYGFTGIFIHTIGENGIACLLIYSISYLLGRLSQQSIPPPQKKTGKQKIIVSHQNSSVLINMEEILYVKSEKPYIALITAEKKYLHPSTLKHFLTEIAPPYFIQIHKSTILNTKTIQAYTSRKNGDYDILLSNGALVRASRSFKAQFQSFLKNISLA